MVDHQVGEREVRVEDPGVYPIDHVGSAVYHVRIGYIAGRVERIDSHLTFDDMKGFGLLVMPLRRMRFVALLADDHLVKGGLGTAV